MTAKKSSARKGAPARPAARKPAGPKSAPRKSAATKPAGPAPGRFQPKRGARHLPDSARRPAAERIGDILARLDRDYPAAECALTHDNALELLVATILSAQCTDERVNIVTRGLFARYSTAADYAGAEPDELESIIRSTGFFRNKARNILGMARKLVSGFGGRVPKTMDELLSLPGVARKTANVVLGTAYGIADGVVVDTHVGRIAQRLGLSRHTDPVKIEADLMALAPRTHWIRLSHQLIHHGRRVCASRAPACDRCGLRELCPSAGAAVDE